MPRPSNSRGTIRFRITAMATVVVAVVLVVAAIALVLTQQRLLTRSLDETIDTRADDLEAALGLPSFDASIERFTDEDDLVQVIDDDGLVVAASPTADAIAPLWSGVPTSQVVSTRSSAGADLRVLARPVQVDDRPAVLVVASRLDDVDEATRILVVSLAITVPLIVGILAGLVWWVVGRTLRPVGAIRSEVASIGGHDLHRRVPVPEVDDEIARLASTMNTMLDRIEEASVRQQRFVADASHELRSPLTRIRSELEIDLAHPDTADATATHTSVLDEAISLQHLVDDLLVLARIDAGARSAVAAPVDLDDVVLSEARRLRDDDRITVDTSGVAPVQVLGRADQLNRVVRNLAENAQRHAATTVRLALAVRDGWAELIVADDGPGVPPDERERIFERFTRVDSARAAADGGAGLGLAIARELVESHDGTVEVADRPGAVFVVRLPPASQP